MPSARDRLQKGDLSKKDLITPLNRAIEDALPERLRKTLLALCKENTDIAVSCSQILLTDTSDDEGGKKRKRAKFEVCVNCDQEFEVDDNSDQKCCYHPGGYQASTVSTSLPILIVS